MNQESLIPLSVVVITFNEEENISRCIQSVTGIASDIVVVDSFSTDRTTLVARELGARVVQHKFEGHIEQKNFAITQARFPFVLSLDADESLDETLRQSIHEVLTHPPHADGYTMNRLNNYCGQWIRHGAWFPDVKLRLWNASKGRWAGTNPHDRFELDRGALIRHLPGNILHYSYRTVAEHENKIGYFSDIAAAAYLRKGKKGSALHVLLSPIVRFVRDYILRLGILDGMNGLRIAKFSARETRMKYQKLLKLRSRSSFHHEG